MSSELRLRRGTNTEHASFTGADSEATVNTTNKSIHVHDGTTAGGFELARADLNNVSNTTFAAKATAAGVGSGGSGSLTSTITAITKASPAVVTTSAAHNYNDYQQVTITNVGGMTQVNGNSYYIDVLTSNTFALYTDLTLTTPVNSTAYTTYTSGGSAVGAVSSGAPVSASYVTINAESGLPNERRLQAGTGLTLSDGGAGGAVSLAANLAATAPSNLGSANAGVSNVIARADHVHAMPTASDVGAVPTSRAVLAGTGLSVTNSGQLNSNITLSLNANLHMLTDVTIGTLVNGDVLMYNEGTSQFENSSTFAKNSILLNNASVATNTINKFNFIGSGISAAVNNTDSSRIDITIAASNTADVQTIVGGMVSGNTENGIVVTYDAVAGKLNFDVADPVITLTGDVTGTATMTNLGNVTITTTVAANSVALGTDTTGNYIATIAANATAGYGGITITGSGVETAAVIIGIDPANADFKESIEDIVGAMVTTNTENGIVVTYDDTAGKLNFDVNDPVITLSGAITGSATMTNLGSTTITTAIAADAVTLGTNTTGNYVATITGANGIAVTGSGTESAAITLSINPANADFKEIVEDLASNLLTVSTHLGLTAVYDDANNKITLDVNDPVITLAGAVAGSATMTNLANTTITVTQQNDSVTLGTHTVGNYVATITGANGIAVTGSGSETAAVTLSINPLNVDFIEIIQDIVGDMVSPPNTEAGIVVTYDDANARLNFDVNDPTITLAGAITGSATMANLGSFTITTAIASDAVALGTNTTGAYVANITGANGITASVNNIESAAVTLSIDTTNAVFKEGIEDIVGGMVTAPNTENGIVVTYDDANAKLNFDVNDPVITLAGDVTGSATMTNLGDVTITATIAANSVELGTDTTGNYVATLSGTNGISVSGSGVESAAVSLTIDPTNANFKEGIEDIVGGMVTGGTQNGIVVSYDDANAKLNFDVNDPVITLSGDVTGSATMTNLGSVTIAATIAANSVELGTDTTGNYVATIAAGNGIAVTGSGVESAAITISVNPAEANFVESIQDIVGGMISDPNTEAGIVVTYDDANAKINFDVNDPTITLAGDITGSATMANLASITITTAIAANSVELGTDTTGNYVATITGANGISVTGSGTESAAIALTLDKTNTEFRNTIQDIAALMFSTGSGLTVTYNDTTNAISIDPNDPLITITGSVVGSATMTNLANTTITVAQANNSVTLGQHTVGNYVANITGANGIVVTGSGVETADVALQVDFGDANFVEAIQDIIGAMVGGNTESGIDVVYDDAGAKLNFNVNDPTITLSGHVSGSAQMVDLGSITITTTVADNSHAHTIANVTGLQAALDGKIGSFNTTMTGTTKVETLVPNVNVAYDLGSSTFRFNNFYATTIYGNATRALYADLAERYQADAKYPIGTVVKLGGTKEITATRTENDTQVVGVISENPAYLMNDGAGDPNEWLPVAMTGRVRVKIVGPVTKGQRIVSSNELGVAKAINDSDIVSFTTVIGRALKSDTDPNIKLVECIIGKF